MELCWYCKNDISNSNEQISRFLCNGDATSWDDDFNGPEQYAYQVVDNTKWKQHRDAKF